MSGAEPLNYYGQPIIPPEYFDGEHIANPGAAGSPPVCSCGWTRHEVDGVWFEMSDHLADMAATAAEPYVVTFKPYVVTFKRDGRASVVRVEARSCAEAIRKTREQFGVSFTVKAPR